MKNRTQISASIVREWVMGNMEMTEGNMGVRMGVGDGKMIEVLIES